jgi:hypothetical protein
MVHGGPARAPGLIQKDHFVTISVVGPAIDPDRGMEGERGPTAFASIAKHDRELTAMDLQAAVVVDEAQLPDLRFRYSRVVLPFSILVRKVSGSNARAAFFRITSPFRISESRDET